MWFDFCTQRLRFTKDEDEASKPKSEAALMREKIIQRAAKEFRDGMYGILQD
mgnify:CR=1 FL=1